MAERELHKRSYTNADYTNADFCNFLWFCVINSVFVWVVLVCLLLIIRHSSQVSDKSSKCAECGNIGDLN